MFVSQGTAMTTRASRASFCNVVYKRYLRWVGSFGNMATLALSNGADCFPPLAVGLLILACVGLQGRVTLAVLGYRVMQIVIWWPLTPVVSGPTSEAIRMSAGFGGQATD